MPRNRYRRSRSLRGRSSVFRPSPQRYSQRFAATASRPAKLGPDVAQALAPQVETMAPEGPIFDELPPVDVEPDFGGGFFDQGEEEQGSPLIDALMQEEEPLAAEPAGPFAGPTGNPEADQALIAAESTYGVPGAETPLAAATQESFNTSAPVPPLRPENQPFDPIATYNKNKLLRMLMEEGY